MKKIKNFSILMVMILIFNLLSGCRGVKYNAVLYDMANSWIKEEFVEENPIQLTGDIIENSTDSNSNERYPLERSFIVNNEQEYKKIFIDGIEELNIDFEEQMILIYTFSTIYKRKNSLRSISVEDKTGKIVYQMETKYGIGDACPPYQRWFAVKLNKIDITAVEFQEK
ncbi:MAG: hypothetical protein IJ393_06695 [Clostridia bacterium]|nr:hypothetical protein [Clostridia bacterium]